MTTKKKTTHKTHKTHKAKAHEKKSQHVSDKISTTSLTENIAVLAVAFLVIGLIVGSLISYGAFMMNGPVEPIITDEQGANLGASAAEVDALKLKVEEYVNTNMLPPEVTFAINGVDQSDEGVFEFSYTITQAGEVVEEGEIHSTKTKLIIGAVVDLDEEIEPLTPPAGAEVEKLEVAEAELFIWGYCPPGVPALDAYADAAAELASVANLKVVLFHDGHGPYETQQNKIQAAIQQLEPEKYWGYAKDFYEDVYPICVQSKSVECDLEESTKLMEKVGIDADAVLALVESEGDALYAADIQRAAEVGVSSSPSLVINGTKLDSFNRTADGFKTEICSGFINAPEACGIELSAVETKSTGSC